MVQPAPQRPVPIDLNYRPPGATLARFRASDAFARCVMGPIHGGRRTACFYDIVLRAADPYYRQHHWRWAVIRATLDELQTHTLPAWQRIVPPSVGNWAEKPPAGTAGQHVLFFSVRDREVGRLEVLFLAMDQPAHRRRLPTLELTAAYLDAARDLPQAVFEEAAAAVGQYPSQLEGGCVWSGVILSARPPAEDHWIPAIFERERRPGHELFRQPPGRSPEAENLQHLPKGFYLRVAQGKPQEWVRTNVDGEYQSPARDDKAAQFHVPDADGVRERCKSLVGFIREAWHVIEPNNEYVHGWHVDAIAQHLEAITAGRINRLLINIPPGTMKSLLVSVLWPAWEWGPCGRSSLRYLTTSYSEDYVKRDARRMRDLITSDWYQALWGDKVRLVRSGEISFANSATGNREGMAFKSLTGGRGDRVIIDDPHSTETAESDAERQRTTRIFRESVPTRLNDPVRSAIIVIMQRLHEHDVAGTAIALKLGYVHLMLPMEFEVARRCSTSIGWTDPRIQEGDLLFPERFPREVVERDKVPMGAYAVAGQFQQRPAPREGGMFKRHWFEGRLVGEAPVGTQWVRHWDLAGSKRTGHANQAFTAGVKLGRSPDGRFYIGHVVRLQEEGPVVRRTILATAEGDGKSVRISLPQDPGQAGKVQAQDMIAMLAGYTAHAEPETGDKITRAEPFAAQAEAGNVWLVRGAWNEAYLDELCTFPAGTKDQVDATSGAFARLAQPRSAPARFVLISHMAR